MLYVVIITCQLPTKEMGIYDNKQSKERFISIAKKKIKKTFRALSYLPPNYLIVILEKSLHTLKLSPNQAN